MRVSGILADKKIIVMGVANKRSIAWGCAQEMERQGATIIYTYQNDRMKRSLQRLVSDDAQLFECDVAMMRASRRPLPALKKLLAP